MELDMLGIQLQEEMEEFANQCMLIHHTVLLTIMETPNSKQFLMNYFMLK